MFLKKREKLLGFSFLQKFKTQILEKKQETVASETLTIGTQWLRKVLVGFSFLQE